MKLEADFNLENEFIQISAGMRNIGFCPKQIVQNELCIFDYW